MHAVNGIGGIIIKSKDATALRTWYATQLGIDVQAWGGTVFDAGSREGGPENPLAWAIHEQASNQFENTAAPFIVNYRVDDVESLVERLRAAGCQVSETVTTSEFGLFAWVIDPDGNKAELWQPT
ncbi:putative enzyme related to lactoylglutathione lyase [Xanthomonas arboricola]|uniref:VOC family protein n=1 Tax=Xanthomonas sp. 3793 TaxID=3035312 RepID=UPI002167D51D|nr:VOC family protein [Xanthomonas sp. 3793]MCS3748667.1 putative enzyme related to lactoylglutathione lyase [Xanthomonas sp. 3793]